MGKTELDDFNEMPSDKAPKKGERVTWDDEPSSEEAVCAVCDALFTPKENRPPIFCPTCKQSLSEILGV